MIFKRYLVKYVVIGFGTIIVMLGSCKKDDDNPSGNPYNGKSLAVFNPYLVYGTMTDQEGNIYRTIKIGDVIWMAENLRTSTYNDGTKIPVVTDNTEWANLSTDACCTYNNNLDYDSIATYGRLYNWFAVSSGKLAPQGWHVATDEEWWALAEDVGGKAIAGGAIKEGGNSSWISPNIGATNAFGFTALASGSRFADGRYTGLGQAFHCWRAEKYLDIYGISWYASYSYDLLGWAFYLQHFGFSVRCVRD